MLAERPSDRNADLWLRLILVGMSAHSALVGLGLLIQPAWLMDQAGYPPLAEPFFARQGGVFHILMAVFYARALGGAEARCTLIPLAILVKAAAAVFLLLHAWLAPGAWVIPFSGVVDGLMAVVLWWVWNQGRRA